MKATIRKTQMQALREALKEGIESLEAGEFVELSNAEIEGYLDSLADSIAL